jgi:hypothetical protein
MNFKIEYLSESDSNGRCEFILRWMDADGRKRGQVFFCDPHDYGFPSPEETKEKMMETI